MIKTLKTHSSQWRTPLFSLFFSLFFFWLPPCNSVKRLHGRQAGCNCWRVLPVKNKVTCSKRHALCNKPNDIQLVWVQIWRSRNDRCWSLISSLHYNQNPEKSRVQITPSEFRLTYIQQNCPDTSTVVNRVNAVLIFLHFND